MRKIGSRTVPLTTELAMRFATMPSTPGEVPLDRKHVEFLHKELVDGRFHSPLWVVAYNDGKEYRINGQHSSTMLTECNGHFPVGMDVFLEEFEVSSTDELCDLFRTYDVARCMRSNGELANQYLRVHPELADVSSSTGVRAVDAIAAVVTGFSKQKLSWDVKARLIHKNVQFIRWFADFRSPKILKDITGAYSAMYSTWLVAPEASDNFWRKVKDQSSHSECPTRVYAQFLMDLRLPTSVAHKEYYRDARAAYVKAVHAWNAWRKGLTTRLHYKADAPLPEPS